MCAGPPTTQQKASALMAALGGDFGQQIYAPANAIAKVAPSRSYFGWGRRRRRRQPPPPPPPPSCNYADPRDLAIVIDRSGSVGSNNFNQAVNTIASFIGNLCHRFQCASGPETRIALVTYASTVTEVFRQPPQKQATDC